MRDLTGRPHGHSDHTVRQTPGRSPVAHLLNLRTPNLRVHESVTACHVRGGRHRQTQARPVAQRMVWQWPAHPASGHLGGRALCPRVSKGGEEKGSAPPGRKSTSTAAALATDGAPKLGQARGSDLVDGRRLARKHMGSPSPLDRCTDQGHRSVPLMAAASPTLLFRPL